MANLSLFLLLTCTAAAVADFDHRFFNICRVDENNCYKFEDIFENGDLRKDHTEFQLDPGEHHLNQHYLLQDLSDIQFKGSSLYSTKIQCNDNAGLKFVNISGIEFTDIEFFNCGAKQISTTPKSKTEFEVFLVALYFEGCRDVHLNFMKVEAHINATGVVMYDPEGTNSFKNCVFSDSKFINSKSVVQSNTELKGGGGGVYIEFTYCKPNITCADPITVTEIHDVSIIFEQCNFTANKASYLGEITKYKHTLLGGENHLSFGHGGGLSFFVRGYNSDITLSIDSCYFDQNKADRGGGVYARFNNFAYGNTISITNSYFTQNECHSSTGTKGGAVALTDFVNEFDHSTILERKNEFIIENCSFTENFAWKGGAISIFWVQQDTTADRVTSFQICNSDFVGNSGKLGTAVYVAEKIINTRGLVAEINILSSSFNNNSANFYKDQNCPVEIGLGAFYISSSTVNFFDDINFTSNYGTALALTGSKAVFDDCIAMFIDNYGINGGAIAMLGASKIEVNKTVSMTFTNNTAFSHGGAIFAKYIGRQNLLGDTNCFIGPIKEQPNPDKWGISMTFINNKENNGRCHNAIFTTSVLRCTSFGIEEDSQNISNTFHWKGWFYNTTDEEIQCGNYISSDIGNITFNDNKHAVSAYPGWEFTIPVNITDDFEHDITNLAVFSANFDNCIIDTDDDLKDIIVWKDRLELKSEENCNFTLTLYSTGQRVWHLSVNVFMKSCPPGFKYNALGYCECEEWGRFLTCDDKSRVAKILRNVWIGKLTDSNSTSEYEVKSCPYYYCAKRNETYTPLEYDLDNFDICAPNRTGLLCGKCKSGLGPAINSPKYECIECNKTIENIALYVATTYVPLIALFSSLLLFDIRLTSGPANAFILYSQVITTTFTLEANGGVPMDDVFNRSAVTNNLDYFLQAYKYPYNIFNLNFIERFLPPFCISPKMDTPIVLIAECGVALVPFVIIAVIVILLKLKEYFNCSAFCNRCLAQFTRKWSRKIGNALLPSFASIILLSYTKLSIISTTLVHFVKFDSIKERRLYVAPDRTENVYSQWECILGIIILSTVVSTTPFLLLDYPVRAIEWVISKSSVLTRFYPRTKIHILLDLFQGCYKNDMRFFAGVYFLFRLVVNLSFVVCESWIETFVINQITVMVMILLIIWFKPYRPELNYVNYVDVFIFSLLAFQNCFTFYLFVIYKIDPTENNLKYPVYFCIQYAAAFLPLVYMIIVILYKIKATRKLLALICNRLRRKINSNHSFSRLQSSEEEHSILRLADNRRRYDSTGSSKSNETEVPNVRNSPVHPSLYAGKGQYHSETSFQQRDSEKQASTSELVPKMHPQSWGQSQTFTC